MRKLLATAIVLAAASAAASLAEGTHVRSHRRHETQLAGSKPGISGGSNALFVGSKPGMVGDGKTQFVDAQRPAVPR